MRRKVGALVPLEQRIMDVIGDREMYGLEIAREMGLPKKARASGYGTLYRALQRLERTLEPQRLVSRLEPAEEAEAARRPRRRLYRRSLPTPPASTSDGGQE